MFQCNGHVETNTYLCSLACTWMTIIDSQFYIIDSLSLDVSLEWNANLVVAWLQLSDVQCSVFYITLFMFQNLNNWTHPVYFRQSETGISKTILGSEDISGLSCLKKVMGLFVIEMNCTIQSSIYSVFAPVSVRLLSVSKNLYNTMGGSRGGTLPPPSWKITRWYACIFA